jgi:hypothetical protein
LHDHGDEHWERSHLLENERGVRPFGGHLAPCHIVLATEEVGDGL